MARLADCPDCGKAFNPLWRWRHDCNLCKQVRCKACLIRFEFNDISIYPQPEFDSCTSCWKKTVGPLAADYQRAQENFEAIKVFSINYRGKLHVDNRLEELKIVTRFFRQKATAEYSAKLTAAYLGYDAVKDFDNQRGTRETQTKNGKGTFKYSVWSATGLAVTLADAQIAQPQKVIKRSK